MVTTYVLWKNKDAAAQLTAWLHLKYQGVRIRRSKEPYFYHLQFVAEMAGALALLAYEIGLCHDLLEDFPISEQELEEELLSCGYSPADASLIVHSVVELTDEFTAEHYPEMKKAARKKAESERLTSISALSQTVKYADLRYNIRWTIRYDPKHARKYLRKKEKLLRKLNRGDESLRQEVLLEIAEALQDRGKE